jgi:hypothetical protein
VAFGEEITGLDMELNDAVMVTEERGTLEETRAEVLRNGGGRLRTEQERISKREAGVMKWLK